jgi:hypothetical protein
MRPRRRHASGGPQARRCQPAERAWSWRRSRPGSLRSKLRLPAPESARLRPPPPRAPGCAARATARAPGAPRPRRAHLQHDAIWLQREPVVQPGAHHDGRLWGEAAQGRVKGARRGRGARRAGGGFAREAPRRTRRGRAQPARRRLPAASPPSHGHAWACVPGLNSGDAHRGAAHGLSAALCGGPWRRPVACPANTHRPGQGQAGAAGQIRRARAPTQRGRPRARRKRRGRAGATGGSRPAAATEKARRLPTGPPRPAGGRAACHYSGPRTLFSYPCPGVPPGSAYAGRGGGRPRRAGMEGFS